MIPPERRKLIPTADELRGKQFVENWNYWTDQRETLTTRFEDWLVQDRPDATPASAPIAIRG